MLPKMNKHERALAKGPVCRAAQPERRKEKEMPQDVTLAVSHHISPTSKIKQHKRQHLCEAAAAPLIPALPLGKTSGASSNLQDLFMWTWD